MIYVKIQIKILKAIRRFFNLLNNFCILLFFINHICSLNLNLRLLVKLEQSRVN